MTEDTQARLKAIAERAEKATPGPWENTEGDVWIDTRQQVCCGRGSIYGCCGEPDIEGGQELLAQSNPTDAAFIAHAREDIPFLLAEIARLSALTSREEVLEDMEDALGFLTNDADVTDSQRISNAVLSVKSVIRALKVKP